MSKKQSVNLPIVALRGMTILPYMVIHFDVSRDKSRKSIEYALRNGQNVFMISQRSVDVLEPSIDQLYEYGTVCEIRQVTRIPGNILRVQVSGVSKGKLGSLNDDGSMLSGVVEYDNENGSIANESAKGSISNESKARISVLKELCKEWFMYSDKAEAYNRIAKIDDLERLVYTVAAEITTEYEIRQRILEMDDEGYRYEFVCTLITDLIDVESLKKEIMFKVKEKIDKGQREYVLREQIDAIREELGEDVDGTSDADEYSRMAADLKAPDIVHEKIFKEISRLRSMPTHSSEYHVITSYLDTLFEIPWDKLTRDQLNIHGSKRILDNDHYGLEKVKERIVEFLSVRILSGSVTEKDNQTESPIICLVGPPGTGKTSIAKSVAKALGRNYVRVCLGGVRDEAEIRGHRRTYVGAMPGRIVEALIQAGSSNPMMLLDEVDKVGVDARGDTASALLEILDSAQNNAFRDHYVELPIDLSRVFFMATANTTETIPKPLLDRMEIIELNSYTMNEKVHIAKDYLVPKQIVNNSVKGLGIKITTPAIRAIIDNYTREAGVRELERMIGKLCRSAAKAFVLDDYRGPFKIDEGDLEKYLGKVKYLPETKEPEPGVGMVKGLAWTSVGGTTLDVEAVKMPGKGELTLTGQLGDVMKESGRVALGYIRSNAERYGIADEDFAKYDMFVHIPEGATPKDGPSAGITMTLAMISAYTNRMVDNKIAMTGEITLHGKVLPIGGLKEKLLAAKNIGIKKILVPSLNKKDVLDIEEEITKGLTIIYIDTMDEVADIALMGRKGSSARK